MLVQATKRGYLWSNIGAYCLGFLTWGLIAIFLILHTPNVGWSKLDVDGVKTMQVYENRKLTAIHIVAPKDVLIEAYKLESLIKE